MNELLIGDFHIKDYQDTELGLWEYNTTVQAIEQLHTLSKGVDRVVLLGDVLDISTLRGKMLGVLDFLLSGFQADIILLEGNHEKMQDGNYFFNQNQDYLARHNVNFIRGVWKDGIDYFVSHSHIKEIQNLKGRNLYSHFRAGIEIAPDEIDTDKIDFEQVFAGDIHKQLKYKNIMYTGSPTDVKFERQSTKPSVIINGEWEYLNVPRKIVKQYSSVEKFLSSCEPPKKDFLKALVVDNASEFKKLKPMKNVLIEKMTRELKNMRLEEIKDEVSVTGSVKGDFGEFCVQQRPEARDLILSQIATYEVESA